MTGAIERSAVSTGIGPGRNSRIERTAGVERGRLKGRPSNRPAAGNGEGVGGSRPRSTKARFRQVPRRDSQSRRPGPHLSKGNENKNPNNSIERHLAGSFENAYLCEPSSGRF